LKSPQNWGSNDLFRSLVLQKGLHSSKRDNHLQENLFKTAVKKTR
jgi:hypothetical protein